MAMAMAPPGLPPEPPSSRDGNAHGWSTGRSLAAVYGQHALKWTPLMVCRIASATDQSAAVLGLSQADVARIFGMRLADWESALRSGKPAIPPHAAMDLIHIQRRVTRLVGHERYEVLLFMRKPLRMTKIPEGAMVDRERSGEGFGVREHAVQALETAGPSIVVEPPGDMIRRGEWQRILLLQRLDELIELGLGRNRYGA